LRFRCKLPGVAPGWHHLDAKPAEHLIDSAGAGDWLSAGLIYALCTGGYRKFSQTTQEKLLNGLALGQALASWNCGFPGARGGMYTSEIGAIWQLVKSYLSAPVRIVTPRAMSEVSELSQICESCRADCRQGLPSNRAMAHWRS
jgi:fructokinase